MVSFRTRTHEFRPGGEIVEVVVDEKVTAVIYPSGDKGIKIVSAHLKDVQTDKDFADRVIWDDGSNSVIPIPAVLVMFEPGPYEIRGGKIVRQNQG